MRFSEIFSQLTELAAQSPDPVWQNAAGLFNDSWEPLCCAFNQFPDGLAPTRERLRNQTLRETLMQSAESRAIAHAARHGIPTGGRHLMALWACSPESARMIIQSGIQTVTISRAIHRAVLHAYGPRMGTGLAMLVEAGVTVVHYSGGVEGASAVRIDGEYLRVTESGISL